MLSRIIETAEEAGEAILGFYTEEPVISHKEDHSPLTQADIAANHIILNALQKIDPHTPVISEESPVPAYGQRKKWSRFWLVDPLDGTREFIKRNGEFTVNIALIEDGIPKMGVVLAPAQKLLYFAEVGTGSFRKEENGQVHRIYSEAASPEDELVLIESRSHRSEALEAWLEENGIKSREVIRCGSSIKICRVAEGMADLYPRIAPSMEWDVAAGDAIYRYSAKAGVHESGIAYNKETLLNPGFVFGIPPSVLPAPQRK